ncbi:uncharacterized protein TNCV_920561 [Trichonephila clavipes]|nr:uncharacterized protein TNCV_920561 [Trichonephila clavipes]
MFDPSSFVNSTPLAHADISRAVVLPRGGTSQWRPTRFNLYDSDNWGCQRESPYKSYFVRLEPKVQDYVEVRNPQNTVQLLEVLAKFEERYSGKAIRGSRNSDNVEGRGWNERRMSNVGNNRGNWRNSEVMRRPNNGRNDYRGNYENGRQGNQWFESRNMFQNDGRRFNDRGYQFRNRGQNDNFRRGEHRNKGSSENFN